MEKLKLAVLISGRGSNLKALIDACIMPGFPAEIVLVISGSPDAAGLKYAQDARISAHSVDRRDFRNRIEADSRMTSMLQNAGVELVCLAGYMRMLSDEFCAHWRNRMINIHPSLLPAFKGLNVQQAALDSGVRFSGCTVHYVRPDMDTGPIIIQAAVPVLPDDTAAVLADRILIEEHRIYPQAVRLIADGRVTIDNERAIIAGHCTPQGAITNPQPDRQS